MARYFMQDTRLAAFERMMMEVPRQRDAEKKPRQREKKGIPPPSIKQDRSKNGEGGKES